MYISIVTYIDTCVLHNSVAFLIKADDVTDLDIIRIDFLTIVRLAGGTMRQIDTIVCIKAILNQTGTVEYVGAGFAIFVIARQPDGQEAGDGSDGRAGGHRGA